MQPHKLLYRTSNKWFTVVICGVVSSDNMAGVHKLQRKIHESVMWKHQNLFINKLLVLTNCTRTPFVCSITAHFFSDLSSQTFCSHPFSFAQFFQRPLWPGFQTHEFTMMDVCSSFGVFVRCWVTCLGLGGESAPDFTRSSTQKVIKRLYGLCHIVVKKAITSVRIESVSTSDERPDDDSSVWTEERV